MKKTLLSLAIAIFSMSAFAQSEKPVYNETTNTGYETFADAFAAINSGDECTLIITGQVDIASRMMFDGSKKATVTIKGKDADASLVYKIGDAIMFIMKQQAQLTFENITIDGNNCKKNRSLIEAENKGLTLRNVTIKNYNSTNTNGIINIKNSGWGVFENVIVENCEENNFFHLQRNSSTVKGVNKFNCKLAEGIFLKNEGVTAGNDITITLAAASPAVDTKVVEGCDNPAYFTLANEGLKLTAKDGNLVVADDTESGINDIVEADNSDAPVEYYNLQGVKVNNPDKGIYIMRQGTKARKVIL